MFSDLRESHVQSLLSLGSETRGSEPNQPTWREVTGPFKCLHGARRISVPTPCQHQEAEKQGWAQLCHHWSLCCRRRAGPEPLPQPPFPRHHWGCLSRTGRPCLAQHRLCKEGMPGTPGLSQCQPPRVTLCRRGSQQCLNWKPGEIPEWFVCSGRSGRWEGLCTL